MPLIDRTFTDAGTDKIRLARPAIDAMARWLNGLMGGDVDPMTSGEKASARGVLGAAGVAVNNLFTAAQRGQIAVLTDAATITPDFGVANMFRVQLGGNRILANPTNLVEGQSGSIDIHQDNTGGRTLTFDWGWDFPGGTVPSLTSSIRAKDKLGYQVDVARQSAVTISIATPGVVTWNNHGLLAGQQVRLTTTGALPTGLSINTTYFVIPVDNNNFQLAATRTGAAINTSGTQSGTHTMSAVSITANMLNAVN